MRAEDAVYGGEMSAPSLFSGFLLLRQRHDPLASGSASLCVQSHQPLSALVDDCMQRYPASGENQPST